MNTLLILSLLVTQQSLPPRPAGAPTGSTFAKSIADAPLEPRERKAVAAILAGNVPDGWRSFVPVTARHDDHTLIYKVSPDYLSIGTDADPFRIPLTPYSAQKVAESLDCLLPTPKMVDDIYAQATVKLTPAPIPPSPRMTSVYVFLDHNQSIGPQTAGKLVAGHKKDVVLTSKLAERPDKVAIYGWHRPDGKPIQPLYTGHTAAWVDYSHGIRLISKAMILDGQPTNADAILADPKLAPLLSNEGVLTRTKYALDRFPSLAPAPIKPDKGETLDTFTFDPGVRVVINRPDPFPKDRPALLVLYALPNGNTIEWTTGKTLRPGDDWHYDIQHIAAQTRFLRQRSPDRSIVVAYLENELKAWPAWRRTHGDSRIPLLIDEVRKHIPPSGPMRLVLTGHSGGGSMTFGYLNTLQDVPAEVERIAFLDSNYAYETEKHRDKLARWLKGQRDARLVVLAYNDAVALLNGKSFVSASGGTWGRSRAMLDDFGPLFPFEESRKGNLRTLKALDGRVLFQFLENPDRTIWHTVQIEKNGLIEAMLAGTDQHARGYEYLGPRAYSRFIRPD